jgi:hypothetical protein
MKKIFFFTAIASLSLGSCRKEATISANDQTSVQGQTQTNASNGQVRTSTSANEAAVSYSDVFTISIVGQSAYNSCTGKVMTAVSGKIVINVHGVVNKSNSTMIVHVNAQDQKAIDEDGRIYITNGTFNEQESTFSNGTLTTKLSHFDRWITAGSDNNAIIKDIIYIKADADGNVTIIRDENHETYCQ